MKSKKSKRILRRMGWIYLGAFVFVAKFLLIISIIFIPLYFALKQECHFWEFTLYDMFDN